MNKAHSKFTLVSRIIGNQRANSKRRGHVPPTYNIKELREWLYDKIEYHILYDKWKKSGYQRGLSPSCDRINNDLPYTLNNIVLTTWDENKQRGHLDVRSKKVKNPTLLNGGHCAVEKWSRDRQTLLHTYISQSEAVRDNPGVFQGNISKVCKGELNHTGGFHWKFSGNTKEK